MDKNEAEEIGRRKTRSMTAVERSELKRDRTSTFWLRMENTTKAAQTEESTSLKTSEGGQTSLKTRGQNQTKSFMEDEASKGGQTSLKTRCHNLTEDFMEDGALGH